VIGAARFVIGALIALGMAKARRHSLRVTDRAGTWRRSIFGTLAPVEAFFALGSRRIGVGDAATLGATAPVFVALLSRPLLGERVGAHVSLAVALAFTGVIAVVRPSFEIAAPVAAVATAPVTALSNLGIVFTHLLAIPLFAARPGPWEISGALLVIAATGLLTADRW
jgi:drug/metabolite transporter (DMT)-like permease